MVGCVVGVCSVVIFVCEGRKMRMAGKLSVGAAMSRGQNRRCGIGRNIRPLARSENGDTYRRKKKRAYTVGDACTSGGQRLTHWMAYSSTTTT